MALTKSEHWGSCAWMELQVESVAVGDLIALKGVHNCGENSFLHVQVVINRGGWL